MSEQITDLDFNLEIFGIIDASAGLVVGLASDVKADKNSKNKKRDLNSVLFYLRTTREREYTPAEDAPQRMEMSPAVRIAMEAKMRRNGTELQDYSKGHNTYVYELDKDAFEEVIGIPYDECDLVEDFLNKNANVVFDLFAEDPYRVSVDEITASEWKSLPESQQKGYQEKKSSSGKDGVLLTHKKQQIYRKTVFYPISWGVRDEILEHDQDLSRNAKKPTATKARRGRKSPQVETA